MRMQRFSLGIAGVLAVFFFSFSAHANKIGITGFSGKGGAAATCSGGCHGVNASSLIPTVELTGPTSLNTGATGNYTLIIRNGPGVKGGMNVAVSSTTATLSNVGTDLRVANRELTHTAPKAFTANEVRFDFTLVAPPAAGTITLYASGNSTDDGNTSDGDRSVSITKDVQINAETTNPDPVDPPKDEGGCAAAGGGPFVLLVGLVAARLRRRRS
jgi:uncharacterized protein (TIGR03382 family)